MSQPLFDNLHELRSRIESAQNIILFLDFDGTLVPIVPYPAEARLAPETRLVLERLAQQKGLMVAIISGRSLADLSARVGLSGVIYAGNHGLEIQGESIGFLESRAIHMRPMLAAQAELLSQRLRDIPGVQIENKGLTLSIHYRRVPFSLQNTVVSLVREKVRDTGRFHLTEGKKVIEIRPPVDWHKGEAVRWIQKQMTNPALPIYIGDDSTDEDGFSVLPDGVTIRVGDSTGTLARYTVADPEEVRRFLRWLLREMAR